MGYPGVNRDLRDCAENFGHFRDKRPLYPIGFPEAKGAESETLQMREVAMMILMDQITDKPDWHRKVFDDAIVQKWRDEARQQPEDGLFARILEGKEAGNKPQPRMRIISEQVFEFCIAELRSKAEYFNKSGLIPTLDAPKHSIVKSDGFLESGLRQDLIKAFDTLRADQAANVDWHPHSGDMVQDLVHPSMYPFVYGESYFLQDEVVGVSRALDFIGQGKPVTKNNSADLMIDGRPRESWSYGVGSGKVAPKMWSDTYQWLPANVIFREDGSSELASYVNNLHPKKHADIYKTIERAIDSAIPAWDQCLSEWLDYNDTRLAGRGESRFKKITGASDEDDGLWTPELDVEHFKDADIPLSREELIDLDRECSWRVPGGRAYKRDMEEERRRSKAGLPPLTPHIDDESLARAKWVKYREALLPEPKAFEEIDYTPTQSIRDKFREQGLQVIVKMASIELTPEKLEFPAGGWHLEGQMNEKICATALFYVDSENVTSNHLSFRMHTNAYLNDEISAGQDQYNYLERVFGTGLGFNSDADCLQTYGDVETRMGRLLAFPNVFQHRVSSFKLQDPTKPGHRRFLALWLIDPHRRIVSTANVPPQQKKWWSDAASEGGLKVQGERDVKEARVLPGLMTEDEARKHRLALMEERSGNQREGRRTEAWAQYAFCEH